VIVIPGKLAIASATRNPGISRILDAGPGSGPGQAFTGMTQKMNSLLNEF
jgi:hypothetical protein